MNNDMLNCSIILSTDSYKFSHWIQYPQNTTAMYSYLESRGGKYNKIVFFGLQYYLQKFLTKRITVDDVNEANEFAKLHGVPFNYDGWLRIATVLNGKLPLKIKAVPEGSIIPIKNVLLTIESTDKETFWIVNWVESLLMQIWYTTTVATHSYHIKKTIKQYFDISVDSDKLDNINFQLHDFGLRGCTSQEQAILGGMAHLINFRGTDTVPALWGARKYYNEKIAGYSIPASEHSTMTMWGREGEVEALRNMIKQYGDKPIFACVSDQYDFFNACENIWGGALRDEVLNMKATLVVRPDSGDPIECIVKGLQIFDRKFGSTVNSKGYKILNKVRMIQGDGINEFDICNILDAVLAAGFSAENVNYGMGGSLLQKDINRDTQKFAFKCSWAMINGKEIPVFKDPITDNGKKSKKGRLQLSLLNNNTVRTLPLGSAGDDLLETVFENGEIKKTYSFEDVRHNSQKEYDQYIGWVDRDCY